MALRRCSVKLAIERDDAAERRLRVGLEGAVVGGAERIGLGDAARVGVLDDDAGGPLGELLHAFERGVGVGDVVVGQLLALQLAGARDRARSRIALHIERGLLMRVLAVAQRLRLAHLHVNVRGKPSALASG